MEIKGLDYNTQREKLLMPEYGREIQKMIDHAVSLPTKAARQACAKTIVRLMETKVPQIRENADYQQTLWDHLYLMSHKQLDIDWPFDVSEAEKILSKPAPLKLPQGSIKQRHYGRLIEELMEKLRQMPPGSERDTLARLAAYQMKRDLMTWGHGSVDSEKVADDMARYTDGAVQLDLNTFTLNKVTAATETVKKSKKRR
ncbi:MAG: DUF4290 domain-containing protein [Prevotella sp.]|nr:DUF4290 domain-containing protein [Prevotella sp.]